MKNYACQISLFVVLFFAFLLSPPLSYAQSNIDQASRETDRLGREGLKDALPPFPETPPEIEMEKPPVQEGETKFFIKKINLAGCESFPAEEFYPIVSQYENTETSLTELNGLAKKIETQYLKRGIIAAVFIPPQDIREETITLQVVEAKMGDLQIEDHKYFKKKMLQYYWQIQKGEILRYDEMSKSLELMNKNPDRQVKAVLHAGKESGASDVLLTPQTSFPLHLTSSFDNEGAASTGKARIGVGGRHNNFLGFDDSLIVGHTFGKDFYSIYAYHSLPVNHQGASVLYGYSFSIAEPKKDITSSTVESNAKNSTFSIHQDLFNKGERYGEAFLGFDAKDKTITTNTGTYSRDRLRIVSGGFSFNHNGSNSTSFLKPALYQGINGLGARPRSNLTSREAGNTFTKFTLDFNHKHALPLHLQGNFKFSGQLCNEKLTPQEEFYLGGIDSVRGYPSGDFLADNALQTNLELLVPSFFIPSRWKLPFDGKTFREEMTFLAFYDYGYGIKRNPENTEGQSGNLMSLGTGVRIRFYDKAVLRFEWGFPIADKSITESGDSRFHFAIENQF